MRDAAGANRIAKRDLNFKANCGGGAAAANRRLGKGGDWCGEPGTTSYENVPNAQVSHFAQFSEENW